MFLFLCVGLTLLGCQNKMGQTIKKKLSTPFTTSVNFKKLDGKNIVTTIQYQLLINLNLTLLEYDKNANLNTLLAEDYSITNNTINFQIKKGIKTVSGHEIKARDAEISLKRLLNSKEGSHSKLADLLCTEDLQDAICPGITSSEYELKITARKKSYIPFILSLLTNADNVILPLTALDSNRYDSHIINFKETTGPYFIDLEKVEDMEIDKFKLQLNERHPMASSDMAKEVIYTKTDRNNILQNKKLNKSFNYIQNVTGLKLSDISDLQEHDSSLKILPTLELKNTIILTTSKGRKDFSEVERIHYGLQIKNLILNSASGKPNILEEQIEFFPTASDGNLRDDQKIKVLETYENIAKTVLISNREIRVGLYKMTYERYKDELMKIKGLIIVPVTNSPLEKNTEKVDMFIDTIDSSFTESLDLLQYNKTFGIFSITDNLMQKYVDAESKEIRIKILQDIHFKSITEGYFVNIGAAPYYTILDKEWSAEPSKFFVGFPIWKIIKAK